MRIMVVSPHPDDETLGAGGSLMRLKQEGNEIYWLNVTSISEKMGYSKIEIEKRQSQIEKIEQFYNVNGFHNLELQTTRLENYDSGDIISQIGEIMNEWQPEWIFLPDYNDAHSDHKCVFDWCLACTKTFRYPFIKKIVAMEILSESNFGRPENPFFPTMFIDISEQMEKKKKAMAVYESELGEHPFPRSIEAIESLGVLRGSQAGVKYAEGFRVIKIIH